MAIATTDTKQAVALIDSVDGPAFFHETGRSAIAYRIGADRPDEAIKIIEGIRRNRWAPQWQAGAFGWLAVALAPRDRVRAYSLIDRALMLTIEQADWMGPGDEMAIAARVAACAPDRLPRHGQRDRPRDGGPTRQPSQRVQRPGPADRVAHDGRRPPGPHRPRRGAHGARTGRVAQRPRPGHALEHAPDPG